MNELFLSYIVNVVLGIFGYFLKSNADALRDRLEKTEKELAELRNSFVKEKHFDDFKRDLWERLDRMERSGRSN